MTYVQRCMRPATKLDREFVAFVTEVCMREYVELTLGQMAAELTGRIPARHPSDSSVW